MAENNDNVILELKIGDLLQIDIADNKTVSSHVEYLQGTTIWAADFLNDIWNYRWRRQAFDVSYMKGDRCFSFLAEIEGKDTIERLAVTRMTRISQVQEIQRRASYRLPYTFDVYLRRKWSKDNPDEEKEYTCCKGIDISETGIGFTTDISKWRESDAVQCKFVMDAEEFVFDATIMRRVAWFRDNIYIYRLGIRFHTDDEKQLREIRRFIFKEQIARKL